MGKGRDKKKNLSKNKNKTAGEVKKKQSQGDELKKSSKRSKLTRDSDDEDIDAIIESFKVKVHLILLTY